MRWQLYDYGAVFSVARPPGSGRRCLRRGADSRGFWAAYWQCRSARGTGAKLAVLSNAPAELADDFDQRSWLAPFEPRLAVLTGQVVPEAVGKGGLWCVPSE